MEQQSCYKKSCSNSIQGRYNWVIRHIFLWWKCEEKKNTAIQREFHVPISNVSIRDLPIQATWSLNNVSLPIYNNIFTHIFCQMMQCFWNWFISISLKQLIIHHYPGAWCDILHAKLQILIWFIKGSLACKTTERNCYFIWAIVSSHQQILSYLLLHLNFHEIDGKTGTRNYYCNYRILLMGKYWNIYIYIYIFPMIYHSGGQTEYIYIYIYTVYVYI